MDMDSKDVEKRIREVIQREGLTITEVANRMGKSKQTVGTILSAGNPTISTLADFSKAIGVPISELYPSDENANDMDTKTDLTALVEHRGKHYKATTLEELRGIVEELERATAEATSAETSGRSDGR